MQEITKEFLDGELKELQDEMKTLRAAYDKCGDNEFVRGELEDDIGFLAKEIRDKRIELRNISPDA